MREARVFSLFSINVFGKSHYEDRPWQAIQVQNPLRINTTRPVFLVSGFYVVNDRQRSSDETSYLFVKIVKTEIASD